MVKYIDADTLIKRVKDLPTWWADGGGYYGGAMKYPEGMFEPEDVIGIIKNVPAADVAPVVRCQDCMYWTKMKDSAQGRCALFCHYPTGGWYCANGERKEDE